MKGLKSNISLEEFDKLMPNDDMPPSKKNDQTGEKGVTRFSSHNNNNNNEEKTFQIKINTQTSTLENIW